MCFLDSPEQMGSERFWAKQAVITTTREDAVHLPKRQWGVDLWYAAHFPVIDQSAYASAAGSVGCRQFLSWDPLWRKPLAEESYFAKATPSSGTIYKEGLQIPWRDWLTAGPLPQYAVRSLLQLLPLPTDVALEHSPLNFPHRSVSTANFRESELPQKLEDLGLNWGSGSMSQFPPQ